MATACTDDMPTTVAPPQLPISTQVVASDGGSSESIGESFAINRFSAPEVQVIGAIRPGVPFQVRATARVEFDTPDAELFISFPDLDDAAARGGRTRLGAQPGTRVGQRPISKAEWRGAAGRGQVISQTATLTVPAPGYYRVQVVVRAPNAEYLLPDGRGVQNVNGHDEWLLVCRNGGRATGRWGRVSIAGFRGGMAPGRFRNGYDCADAGGAGMQITATTRLALPPEDCEPELMEPGLASPASATRSRVQPSVIDPCDPPGGGGDPPPPAPRLYGRVLYTNYAGYTTLPLPKAHVYTKRLSGWSSPWVTTDTGGYFNVECPPAGATDALVEVWAENNDVIVLDTDTARSNHYVPPAALGAMAVDASDCGGPTHQMILTSPKQAELYHNHNVAIARSRAIFGAAGTLSKLKVIIKRPEDSLTARTGPWGTEFSRRGQMVDSITFREPDAVGTYAQFIVPHEYAHAAHHTNLGGISGFQRANNCQGHFINVPNSMGCAAVEGFADFWAALARWPTPIGDSVHYVYRDLDRNRYLYNDGSSPQDGSRVEGAVASFLLDVVDGVGADTVVGYGAFTDNVDLSPSVVTNVVLNCHAFTYTDTISINNHVTERADGVDHWAYCLEKEMRHVYIYTMGGSCTSGCSTQTWSNEMHPSVPKTYFRARYAANRRTAAWDIGGAPPSQYTQSLPEVRRLWLCNLYAQRCSGSVAGPYP
jgi:hypothetical protein